MRTLDTTDAQVTPKPSTLNPKPETLDTTDAQVTPKPSTLNPKP